MPNNKVGTALKRREHPKTRSGCGNCRLRRVKCDEAFPECRKCVIFGIYCNYNVRIPELQPRCLTSQIASVRVVGGEDTHTMAGLTDQDLGQLRRFRVRTAVSFGPPELQQLYQEGLCRLMLRHSFLLYFCLTLTSIHDRYLSSTPGHRSVQEVKNWNKGIALLNKKLSAPLHPSDQDAVWASASILGVITFASIEATTPEQSWPLAPSRSLEWLKMAQGKSTLWQLTRPGRPDSIFCVLLSTLPQISSALDRVPAAFVDLFDLHGGDNHNNSDNPYALPVTGIFGSSDMALFFAMNSWMLGEFGKLVMARDSRALLIMAYWYAKIWSHGKWWMQERAFQEGQATCIYLERHFPNDENIQDLLKWPRECFSMKQPSTLTITSAT